MLVALEFEKGGRDSDEGLKSILQNTCKEIATVIVIEIVVLKGI